MSIITVRQWIRRGGRTFWLVGFVFASSPFARAATLEGLQAQIENLERRHEQQLTELKRQIEDLKAQQARQQATEVAAPPPSTPQPAWPTTPQQQPFYRQGRFTFFPQNPAGFGQVVVGGYGDIEFENFENTRSTFDQARFVLNVGAQLHERLLFYSEAEIEHGGPNAPDVGEFKMEQAWMDYRINDLVNLRGGIILPPMGKFNLLHDSDLQELTERPLVARRIIPSTWQEVGFGGHGELDFAEQLETGPLNNLLLNYQWYLVNGLDGDISDAGLRNARGAIETDVNNNKAIVGRLGISPAQGYEIGLAGYAGKYGDPGGLLDGQGLNDRILGWAADLDLTHGPLQLVGDLAWFGFEEGALVDHDNDNASGDLVHAPGRMWGFYLEPRYRFWPRFLNGTFLARGLNDPKLTLVGRYDYVKIADDGDPGTEANIEQRWTIGFNYRPVRSWVWKWEWQWNRTDNEALERGNNNGFLTSLAFGF